MTTEQQIREQRQRFQQARTQVEQTIKKIPETSQQLLRKAEGIAGRESVRKLQEAREKTKQAAKQLTKKKEQFEKEIARKAPQYALPEYRDKVISNIRSQIAQQIKEKQESLKYVKSEVSNRIRGEIRALKQISKQNPLLLAQVGISKILKSAKRSGLVGSKIEEQFKEYVESTRASIKEPQINSFDLEKLAIEKGFIKPLPEPLREGIRKFEARQQAQLQSIAPEFREPKITVGQLAKDILKSPLEPPLKVLEQPTKQLGYKTGVLVPEKYITTPARERLKSYVEPVTSSFKEGGIIKESKELVEVGFSPVQTEEMPKDLAKKYQELQKVTDRDTAYERYKILQEAQREKRKIDIEGEKLEKTLKQLEIVEAKDPTLITDITGLEGLSEEKKQLVIENKNLVERYNRYKELLKKETGFTPVKLEDFGKKVEKYNKKTEGFTSPYGLLLKKDPTSAYINYGAGMAAEFFLFRKIPLGKAQKALSKIKALQKLAKAPRIAKIGLTGLAGAGLVTLPAIPEYKRFGLGTAIAGTTGRAVGLGLIDVPARVGLGKLKEFRTAKLEIIPKSQLDVNTVLVKKPTTFAVTQAKQTFYIKEIPRGKIISKDIYGKLQLFKRPSPKVKITDIEKIFVTDIRKAVKPEELEKLLLGLPKRQRDIFFKTFGTKDLRVAFPKSLQAAKGKSAYYLLFTKQIKPSVPFMGRPKLPSIQIAKTYSPIGDIKVAPSIGLGLKTPKTKLFSLAAKGEMLKIPTGRIVKESKIIKTISGTQQLYKKAPIQLVRGRLKIIEKLPDIPFGIKKSDLKAIAPKAPKGLELVSEQEIKELISQIDEQIIKSFQIPKAPVITKVKPIIAKPTIIAPALKQIPEKSIPKSWMGVYDVVEPTYATPPKIKTEITPTLSQIARTAPKLKISEQLKISPKTREKLKVSPLSLTDILPKERTLERTRELTRTRMGLKTLQKQQLKLKQITQPTIPREITRPRPTPTPTPPPPPIIPIISFPKGTTQNILKRSKKSYSKAYRLMIKRFGKYKPIGEYKRGEALRRGEKITRETLAASFKLEPTKKLIKGKTKPYKVSDIFRPYKIRKGKKIPLLDEFIQKRGTRLGTRTEVGAIQRARKSKRRLKLL